MKIFIDSANLNEIREAHSWGAVNGVTTNPTLIAKENRDFRELVLGICAIIDGPISIEVVSSKAEEIVPEAEELARIHRNIVVKIPVTKEGLKATKILATKGVKVNMTLVFSPTQALFAAKAGATFASPFIGRLDDITLHGMDLIQDIVTIYRNYSYKTEIIVASVRNPLHVVEAARMGAHIATVPFSVIENLVRHPLTDSGVERFMNDWKRVPKRAPAQAENHAPAPPQQP